jgi:hypothetical protein
MFQLKNDKKMFRYINKRAMMALKSFNCIKALGAGLILTQGPFLTNLVDFH